MLPVDAHRDAILAGLNNGRLILVAPPGTGKSTHVPPMIPMEWGKVAVLQPRRIAARNLAYRVAEENGWTLGNEVGYQVRFEGKCSAQTRIVFQTYGVFFQRLLDDLDLKDIGVVLFDEFHERALECDAALAFCLRLQMQKRPDLKIAVMSATLESQALLAYAAPATMVEVASPLHPVTISHQPPAQQVPIWEQATRALRGLLAQGFSGSVLVFLPGVGEIRRTAEAFDPVCRRAGLAVHELHGGMDLDAQQKTLQAPQRGPCAILATNVAETSLTIPGVSAVIDSGLQRVAAYNPERDMDTLYLKSISQHSATQRAGRAGRMGPGQCVRLWSPERERAMALTLEPEVRRVDLTPLALKILALQAGEKVGADSKPWNWLDDPTPALWNHAQENLARIGALEKAGISSVGRALLRWSIHPLPGHALLLASQGGDGLVFTVVAAMAACLETESRRNPAASSDLFVQGRDLVRDPKDRQVDRELRESWQRLLRHGPGKASQGQDATYTFADAAENAGPELRALATRCFIPAFIDRLAGRFEQSQSFVLADGRRGLVEARHLPADVNLILALEMHETGGAGKVRQISIPLLLPIEPDWVSEIWPNEIAWTKENLWDETRGRSVTVKKQMFRGIVLRREVIEGEGRALASDMLVEKLISGEITLPGFDEEAQQIVYRIQLAAATCPDMGLPKLDDEDWRLIYHDICEGKNSLKQLESVSVAAALRDYLGYSLWAWLEREAPASLALPGGKRGRITYSPKGLPEISARLGDFVGLQGKTFILQKRVIVNYDILAPNYRTVQKTQDLTSFWENTYPEVKKELKRRYPRHPWP